MNITYQRDSAKKFPMSKFKQDDLLAIPEDNDEEAKESNRLSRKRIQSPFLIKNGSIL